MVSGGLAALFAAFLGFLICEKFGLELLDSGDFYIAFMYGVFATFSLRPLTRCITRGESSYHVLSPKHLFTFNVSFILMLCSTNFPAPYTPPFVHILPTLLRFWVILKFFLLHVQLHY